MSRPTSSRSQRSPDSRSSTSIPGDEATSSGFLPLPPHLLERSNRLTDGTPAGRTVHRPATLSDERITRKGYVMSRAVAFTTVAVVTLGLAAAGMAAAKPWQWTTAQARAAITAQGDDIYVSQDGYFLPRDLESISCRGRGRHVAGRFTSFRCPARFEKSERAVVWAKTRRAGGICWSTISLAAVPSGCLAAGRRARGSGADAFRAITQKVGMPSGSFRCVANGLGFYSCAWTTGGVEQKATVVFSPRPVVRVLS